MRQIKVQFEAGVQVIELGQVRMVTDDETFLVPHFVGSRPSIPVAIIRRDGDESNSPLEITGDQ